MATVSKNFRVKNGLVVEGSTATVNGYDVLKKSTADENYIIDLIGGTATSANTANSVVKRDGSGNFSAGTITADLTGDVTGTVSSLSNHDTDDLSEGSSNQYFTDARAKSSAADLLTNANLTNITITGSGNGLTITAENGVADSDTDDLAEGTTNLYFTNSRARQAISGSGVVDYNSSTGSISLSYYTGLTNNGGKLEIDRTTVDGWYDASGAATTAESNANTYTDNAIGALDTDDISEGTTNKYFTNQRALDATASAYDAYGAASSAEGNANTYTDNQIAALDTDDIEEGATNQYYTDARARGAVSAGTGISYNSGTGVISVDNTIATETYVDNAITNLIDGAPGLLDTLNEIAAAINDDASFFTTVANGLNGKLDLTGGTMTGAITLAADPSSNLHAATKQYVDNAASDAQTNAEATAQGALDDVLDATTAFTAINVNDVAKQIAATTGNIAVAAATTAYAWAKADYRSAKLTVKAKNGSHTHISEVIVTLDTSDNIGINEYAITTSNGSLMDITADINSNDVRIRVTPTNANTEIMTVGTLIK
ncbi:hypothetical protein EB001_06065 [bacterium]|nr:hypothetical protein [bacterium]